MKTLILCLTCATCLIAPMNKLYGQEKRFDDRKTVSFGLVQPLLGGFNITYTQQHNRLLFAYSHGTMLNLDHFNGAFKSQSARDYDISQITYISTGFDLGIRVTPDLSLRGEWKWHLNDIRHPLGQRTHYQTLTVGPSAYYQWHPFKKQDVPMSGFVAEFSLRWWPAVYSSLTDYSYHFLNEEGTTETFTHNKGDLFVAASIGWTF